MSLYCHPMNSQGYYPSTSAQDYRCQRDLTLPNGGRGRENYYFQQQTSPFYQSQFAGRNIQVAYPNFQAQQRDTCFHTVFNGGGSVSISTSFRTARYGQNIGFGFDTSVQCSFDNENPELESLKKTHTLFLPPATQPLSRTGSNEPLRIGAAETRMKRVYVLRDVGFGNTLFVRGNGPGMRDPGGNSWKISIPMINDGTPNGWYFEVPEDAPDFEYKVLVNDREWEGGENRKYQKDSMRRQIIVDGDCGYGNQYVLRMGNGARLDKNSWERNIEGRCISSNQWIFEVPENAPSHFEYKAVKILGNNHHILWEQDRNHVWEDRCAEKVNRVAKQQFSPRF